MTKVSTGTLSLTGTNTYTGGPIITVSAGATLSGTVNNWFGNNGNAGALSTTRYTTVGALALDGATVTASETIDTGNYQAFALWGNVTVGGTPASTTVTTATGGYHLGANTTFTVAAT